MKKIFFFMMLSVFCLHATADELPVEYFVTMPTIKSPDVSPDGKHVVALIKNSNGNYDIAVAEFGGTEFSIVAKTENSTNRIFYVGWANNERLVISIGYQENYGNFHFYLPRLYAVNIDGSDFIQLHLRNMRSGHDRKAYYRSDSQIISLLENDDRHILLEMTDGYDEYPNVYKVDIYTNDFEKLFFNEYEISSWFSNSEGEVLWGVQYDERNGLKRTIWHREDSKSEWRPMKTVIAEKDETFGPVVMDETGKFLYVMSNHKLGRRALWKYDVEKSEFADLVFAVEGYDLGGAYTEDGKLTGVYWYEDHLKEHYFDKQDAALVDLVEKTFVGAKVSIYSSDKADKKLIINAVDSNIPQKFYLLDLEARKASFWFSQYPYLEGKRLAVVRPFDYTARDGMKLHGYFTMPVDPTVKNPPLIVMPHGGPFARDYGDFDYMVQLFANRGYAVLQMNFRGSTGFGDAYRKAGYKQIGLKMQTDIVDAVNWAKKNTAIDKDRMCIVGWSYGGYAALTASYQTPELYKCIVSIAGVSDFVAASAAGGWRWESDSIDAIAWGDPTNPEEKKLMEMVSSINHVLEIRRPILLVHGESDGVVAATQSAHFYRKAAENDKDVTYLEIEHGIHGLSTDRERIAAFEAIDSFLKKHLH